MICKKCGNQLHEGDLFCGKCGTMADSAELEAADVFDAADEKAARSGLTARGEDYVQVIDSFLNISDETKQTQKKIEEEFAAVFDAEKFNARKAQEGELIIDVEEPKIVIEASEVEAEDAEIVAEVSDVEIEDAEIVAEVSDVEAEEPEIVIEVPAEESVALSRAEEAIDHTGVEELTIGFDEDDEIDIDLEEGDEIIIDIEAGESFEISLEDDDDLDIEFEDDSDVEIEIDLGAERKPKVNAAAEATAASLAAITAAVASKLSEGKTEQAVERGAEQAVEELPEEASQQQAVAQGAEQAVEELPEQAAEPAEAAPEKTAVKREREQILAEIFKDEDQGIDMDLSDYDEMDADVDVVVQPTVKEVDRSMNLDELTAKGDSELDTMTEDQTGLDYDVDVDMDVDDEIDRMLADIEKEITPEVDASETKASQPKTEDPDDDIESWLDSSEPMSPIRKILYALVTLLLVVAAIVSVGLTVAKDTSFGHAVQSGVDKVQAIFGGAEEEAEEETAYHIEVSENAPEAEVTEFEEPAAEGEGDAATNAETNAGDANNAATNAGDANANAANNAGDANNAAAPAEGGEQAAATQIEATESLVGQAIRKQIDKAGDILKVTEDANLKFPEYKSYGVEGADKAIVFESDLWYTTDTGENKHYSTEVVGLTMEYFAKLMDRMNKDDEAVLKLIAKDTKLMTDVQAIKADAVIVHLIKELRIGEVRKNGDNLYVIVTINEKTNDGKDDTSYTRVLRIDTRDKQALVAEVGEPTK